MRTLTLSFLCVLAATAALARDYRCSPDSIQFGHHQTYVKEEVIDAGSLRSLKAVVRDAPVSVEGGAGAGYTIHACKAAETEAALAQIRVTLDGNELKASGPDNTNRWTVLYHVVAPHDANLDISANNGPLSFDNVDGTIIARAQNGPLSLDGVTGNVTAETTNGPISIEGGSGTMKVQATNGPLSVRLEGNSWNGTLDASTQNGPLTLKLPAGYASGVVVESRGRGPISCSAPGCDRAWRSDEDAEPRRLELGSGSAAVHLSTVNGPVVVKEGRE
jgi:hypothetical protein